MQQRYLWIATLGLSLAAIIAYLVFQAARFPQCRGAVAPQIVAGDGHAVAISAEGHIYGWGRSEFGQAGLGPALKTWQYPRIIPQRASNWVQIATGDNHSLGIKADGSLWAWGRNDFGQLGIGRYDSTSSSSGMPSLRPFPVRVGLETNWAAVEGGVVFSVGLKRDGTLWAWGANCVGQLGNGADPSTLCPLMYHFERADQFFKTNQPMRLGTNSDWAAIAVGTEHVLALNTEGSLWAWGRNDSGQLGEGTTQHRSAPVRIGEETNWLAIAAGGGATGGHSVALKKDGSLWAWGTFCPPADGQFRTNQPNTTRPVCIDAGHDWRQLAAGDGFTLAIKREGSLWILGLDYVGVGGKTNQLFPQFTRVGRRANWVAAAVEGRGYYGGRSQYYAYALAADGTLWIWGSNLQRAANPYALKAQAWLAKCGIKANWSNPTVMSSPARLLNLGLQSQ